MLKVGTLPLYKTAYRSARPPLLYKSTSFEYVKLIYFYTHFSRIEEYIIYKRAFKVLYLAEKIQYMIKIAERMAQRIECVSVSCFAD